MTMSSAPTCKRQIQFGETDAGAPKAARLAEHLRAAHPGLDISSVGQRFRAGDAPTGAMLVDASDNFETRFALNRLAHASRRALVSGAASGWTGQVGVFASGLIPGAPCYQCWVPEAPPAAEACDEIGVAGPVTGMTGSAMALEVLKLVTGAGSSLTGRLLLIDGLAGTRAQRAAAAGHAVPGVQRLISGFDTTPPAGPYRAQSRI
jgi:molybdopterin/thiamine biosynthesis adenylyltransferase